MIDPTPFDSLDDRATVVDALVDEMSQLFHGYVRGEVPFEELSFELFDTLQTLYAVTHSATTIEYHDNENDSTALDGPTYSPRASPNGKKGNHQNTDNGEDNHKGDESGWN